MVQISYLTMAELEAEVAANARNAARYRDRDGIPSKQGDRAEQRAQEYAMLVSLALEHNENEQDEKDEKDAVIACLSRAVQFALSWSGGTAHELHEGIREIVATMPGAPTPTKES